MKYAPLAFVLLAGCASTQAILDKEPTEVFASQKSQDAVSGCLAARNSSSVQRRGDGSHVVLIKNNLYDAVSAAFVVWPEGSNSSRVEYRRSFVALGEYWRSCL